MFPIPKRVFLTQGVGTHRHQLSAFEYALRDADIEQQNLVSVSSILPALRACSTRDRDCGIESRGDNVLRPGPSRDERAWATHCGGNWSCTAEELHALRIHLGAPWVRNVRRGNG